MPGQISISSGTTVKAELALAMIGASLAVPEDWEGDVGEFIGRTLHRWGATVATPEDAGMFRLAVESGPLGEGWYEAEEVHPEGWLVLALYVGQHYGIGLGPAAAALERIDPRLPSAVWDTLTNALRHHFMVWDHRMAIELETYDEHPLLAPEVYWGDGEIDEENRLSPKKDTPRSLQRKPVGERAARNLIRRLQLDPSSWAGRVAYGALTVAELARKGPRSGLQAVQNVFKDAYVDCFGTYPLVSSWISDGDAITHLWDYEGQGLFESGEPIAPSCAWVFHANSSLEVAEVYGKLEHVMRVARRAIEVLQLLDDAPAVEPAPASRKPGKPLLEVLGATASTEEALCS